MFVISTVVVLAASLQVITSQGPPNIPPECRGPPPGVTERPFDCCKIPPFFEPKDFEECGFKKPEDGEGPPPPPHGPPDGWSGDDPHDEEDYFVKYLCSKQLCIMDKYGLSKDGEVDQEAVKAYLDKYGEENETFKPTVETAKERCIDKELPGPPHLCEANKLVFCITHTMISECPVWAETEGCTALKDHLDKCSPHFRKQ